MSSVIPLLSYGWDPPAACWENPRLLAAGTSLLGPAASVVTITPPPPPTLFITSITMSKNSYFLDFTHTQPQP